VMMAASGTMAKDYRAALKAVITGIVYFSVVNHNKRHLI